MLTHLLAAVVSTYIPVAGTIANSTIAYSTSGELYATTLSAPGSLLKINPTSGAVSTVMPLAQFGAMRFDANNNLYMVVNNEFQKIDIPNKTATTIAGKAAQTNNTGANGLLNYPTLIGGDGADLLFVAFAPNYSLQKIVVSTKAVSNLGPTCLGGFTGLANVRGGNMTASCGASHTIVNMSQSGTGVTTVAGSSFVAGSADGTGSSATFNNPQGLADDGAGNVYVADMLNHLIRKVVVSSGAVTTLAGMAGTHGSADGNGLNASFYYPYAVSYDGQGNLYVLDAGNYTIRRIVISSRDVTTIAGTAGMQGTTDAAGAAARFFAPAALTSDTAGNVYVADGSVIRQIVLPGANVTTVVGVQGRWGVILGDTPAANLNSPAGLVMLPNGALAITDSTENAVLTLK